MPNRSRSISLVLYPALVFGLPLFALHYACLALPYFWDELGQFIPAALDILREGAWIPKSTLPNVHPPGVMAYLAFVWKLFGYSITATRVAMLLLADLGLVALFFLSVEVCKPLRGAPAFLPVVLLLASPLFFTQSMLAQLDMPEMVFTVVALHLFLRERFVLCAAACTALVLAKETGAWVPLVFLAWLAYERRFRSAALFIVPILSLCAWLLYLAHGTGTIFGNNEFKHYNLWFPLHPVRLGFTILRRLFGVFIDNFHWIGTIAIVLAWRRSNIYRNRTWAVLAVIAGGHLLLVSVLGGAALERYIMPVIPIFYIAVVAAWTVIPRQWSLWSRVALPVGLLVCLFWNPPWPFPFENNLSVVDFVKLQVEAAEVVEAGYPDAVVASAWPFPDALRRPEFGYVSRPMKVLGIEDFHRASVLKIKDKADVLVVYSRTWEPSWGVFRSAVIRDFLAKYYYYEPQITRDEITRELGLMLIGRSERRGQWIEIYAREQPGRGTLVRLIPFR